MYMIKPLPPIAQHTGHKFCCVSSWWWYAKRRYGNSNSTYRQLVPMSVFGNSIEQSYKMPAELFFPEKGKRLQGG